MRDRGGISSPLVVQFITWRAIVKELFENKAATGWQQRMQRKRDAGFFFLLGRAEAAVYPSLSIKASESGRWIAILQFSPSLLIDTCFVQTNRQWAVWPTMCVVLAAFWWMSLWFSSALGSAVIHENRTYYLGVWHDHLKESFVWRTVDKLGLCIQHIIGQ